MYRTVFVTFFLVGLTLQTFAQTNRVPLPPLPPAITPIITPTPRVTPAAVPAFVPTPISVPPTPAAKPALVWDSENKTYAAKPGEATAPFAFIFTNMSTAQVTINSTATSCGCTAAQLPMQPWPIAPGATGEIKVTMHLAGKMGRVTKQVTVNSSEGSKFLIVNVDIPPAAGAAAENMRGDRNANLEKAKADRQIVFKGDCRSCHVDQGVGKLGKELYAADCAICHETPLRAAMVPDLRAPKAPRDRDYWNNWIAHGRIGSLMPAFSDKEGGPLSQEQIDSLVTYLWETFPRGTASASPATPTPVTIFTPAKSTATQ